MRYTHSPKIEIIDESMAELSNKENNQREQAHVSEIWRSDARDSS